MSQLTRLADEIAAYGKGPVFGVPGSGATLTLIDELEKRGCEFILTHFEGAAAMMAGTVGRLSGKAGLCLSIKGPGVTNMLPGLAVSAFESFPLVAIVEAYGAGTPPAKAHKRIDQAALTGTVSKAITQWTSSSASFADIAALAEAETPGPVMLELAQPEPVAPLSIPRPDKSVDAAAGSLLEMLRQSRRPIVIAGTLAIRQNLSSQLNALRVPVFSTAAAKGVVDETRPFSAGVYTGVGLELSPEQVLLSEADLVVCFGMRPNEVLATKAFGPPAVNIAAVAEAGDKAFGFQAVAGCAHTGEILDALKSKDWGEDKVTAAMGGLRKALLSNVFLPAHVFDAVQTHYAGAVRGVFDTGYFCTIAEHAWHARAASLCLMSGQARYMGTGVPMALGAAIYDRSVPTVVFVGDGGVGPFVGEVKMAVERRLPLLFCLLTDGYLSSIRTRALSENLTQRPVRIERPSWLRVFEGFGMPVFHAHEQDAVAAALAAWRPEDGPAFLEISFEPTPYEAMVKGIR
jgi:acetolactate synthase-1/2/3 large subunit